MSVGIIPARAGFTRAGRCARPASRGSSPLARGLHEPLGGRGGPVGIIPARAGFTGPALADRPTGRGSSPLARGLLFSSRFSWVGRRIIPARAGFTSALSVVSVIGSDHPRSRGVYAPYGAYGWGDEGSSPLARGLLGDDRSCDPHVRIIPARAGFTTPAPLGTPMVVDHPRSRGVYVNYGLVDGAGRGSSPLARGLPVHGPAVGVPGGIIPARAGFTTTSRCATGLSSDHPRSRGVYNPNATWYVCELGSSPLARGLLALRI